MLDQPRKDQFRTMSEAIGKFAFDLYQKFPPFENLAFSPLGIYSVLELLYVGARRDTKRILAKSLHHDLGLSLTPMMGALSDELNTRSQLKDDEIRHLKGEEGWKSLVDRGTPEEEARMLAGTAGPEDVRLELSIANGVWTQDGYPINPEFLEVVQTAMDAEAAALDFAGNPAEACEVINGWIHEKTRGRIGPMLFPGNISKLCRLIAGNAVYFKARWQSEFGPPKPGDFHLIDDSTVQVPMMTREYGMFDYVEEDDFWAVELPYYRRPVSMVIFVPTTNGEEALLALEHRLLRLLVAWPFEDKKRWQMRGVSLTMPEFQFSASYDLTSHLSKLGLQHILTADADFSGINDQEALWLDQVLHNTLISVDQHGTEAAAVTLAVMLTGLPPEEKIDLAVDHPFVFAIVDKPSGAILFLGRVVDPS